MFPRRAYRRVSLCYVKTVEARSANVDHYTVCMMEIAIFLSAEKAHRTIITKFVCAALKETENWHAAEVS